MNCIVLVNGSKVPCRRRLSLSHLILDQNFSEPYTLMTYAISFSFVDSLPFYLAFGAINSIWMDLQTRLKLVAHTCFPPKVWVDC